MSNCLEMLVRVLGFRIVWLRGKYEKMKSVNPQMFLHEILMLSAITVSQV